MIITPKENIVTYIAVGVAGGALLVLIVSLLLFFFLRRRRRNNQTTTNTTLAVRQWKQGKGSEPKSSFFRLLHSFALISTCLSLLCF